MLDFTKFIINNIKRYIDNKVKFNNIILIDEKTNYEYLLTVRNGALFIISKCTGINVDVSKVETEYVTGSTFDTSGIVVTAVCEDGNVIDVTDMCTINYSYTSGRPNSAPLTGENETATIDVTYIDPVRSTGNTTYQYEKYTKSVNVDITIYSL